MLEKRDVKCGEIATAASTLDELKLEAAGFAVGKMYKQSCPSISSLKKVRFSTVSVKPICAAFLPIFIVALLSCIAFSQGNLSKVHGFSILPETGINL